MRCGTCRLPKRWSAPVQRSHNPKKWGRGRSNTEQKDSATMCWCSLVHLTSGVSRIGDNFRPLAVQLGGFLKASRFSDLYLRRTTLRRPDVVYVRADGHMSPKKVLISLPGRHERIMKRELQAWGRGGRYKQLPILFITALDKLDIFTCSS